ncbi:MULTISPECIES: ABC-three component system middle component 1 [Paenibacillus]|uniref:ABC-three component system middle component 1 n=1 Tax=Paenibacillus TaxID=44249 RepID=UPI0030CCD3BC
MEAYNRTFQQLIDADFQETEIANMKDWGVKCFTNGQTISILQRWETEMNTNQIMNEASRMRDLLLRNRLNAWNAYYLLCAGTEAINDEMVYYIEREASALRKYVIRTENDLKRIPFLDINIGNTEGNELNIVEDTSQYGDNVTRLVEYLRQHNGERAKFSQKKIEEAALFIFNEKEL